MIHAGSSKVLSGGNYAHLEKSNVQSQRIIEQNWRSPINTRSSPIKYFTED